MSPFLLFSSFLISHSYHFFQIPISLPELSSLWVGFLFLTSVTCAACSSFLHFFLLYVHFCFFPDVKDSDFFRDLLSSLYSLQCQHRGHIFHLLHGRHFLVTVLYLPFAFTTHLLHFDFLSVKQLTASSDSAVVGEAAVRWPWARLQGGLEFRRTQRFTVKVA